MKRLRFADLGVPPHLPQTHVTRLAVARESTPHTHDFHEMFLVLHGSGIHHLNGRRDDLEAGHLVTIRPADAHWFSAGPDGLVFVNVAVSATWWEACHTTMGWSRPLDASGRVKLGVTDTHRLGIELGRIYADADSLGFIKTLQAVRKALRPSAGPASAATPDWLEALRQDLTSMPAALREPISFWQQRSGCSPEHLSRSCRRFYGMTLRELINAARIERARLLLRTTNKKVIGVAFDCGFDNMANFHRTFARITGMTPNQWRQMGNVTVPMGTTRVVSSASRR